MDPFTTGALDPERQHYKCHIRDFETLVQYSNGQPFTNWISTTLTSTTTTTSITDSILQTVDPCRVETWFPNDEHRMVLYGALGKPGMSYAALHQQIKACPPYATISTSEPIKVALLLPRCLQPEMAVSLIVLLAQPNVCVCPLDYNQPHAKLVEALDHLDCKGIVSTQDFLNQIDSILPSRVQDVRVVESQGTTGTAGAVRWKVLRAIQPTTSGEKSLPLLQVATVSQKPNDYNSWPRMMLRTSGTTAGPKVVALTAGHLLHSAACLAIGLQLKQNDVSCCAMPLFHIGGIAGAWLCVLVSGSAVIMMPGAFDPQAFLDRLDPATNEVNEHGCDSTPTWYYAAPTMHQALLLAAQARGGGVPPNRLRLVRSAAAHLPHTTALELAETFQTNVYPTFGMTESMPICVPSPSDAVVAPSLRPSNVVDSVGRPVGSTVAIVNATTGVPFKYGEIGEIAVGGPGAISSYVGLPITQTHTPDGLLKTGDVGYLDHEGRLFIKGRSKEMIKRGGEQVWPNEVDHVVMKVSGVETAVTFAVPNELWGEEVAVAVVLETSLKDQQDTLRQRILETCKAHLDRFAVPCQVIFLDSTKELAKGPTGKYLRTKMANHLGVKSADTVAIRALKSVSAVTKDDSYRNDKVVKLAATAKPSPALNGARFLTACFVVQTHIGFYQSTAMEKMRNFSVNMPIFFFLLAFQSTCNINADVSSSWSSYVGTKIGTMHAAFVIAMLLSCPVYLLWDCGPTGYYQEIEGETCWENGKLTRYLLWFPRHFLTGLFGYMDWSCGNTWFQSVAYWFLIALPWLDSYLRKLSNRQLLIGFVVMICLSIAWPAYLLHESSEWQYLVVSWVPHLAASSMAAHLFKRFPPLLPRGETDKVPFFQNPHIWAKVSDTVSVVLLFLLLAAAAAPNCMWVEVDVLKTFRPHEVLDPEDQGSFDGDPAQYVCDITWEEYEDYIHDEGQSWVTLGRWQVGLADFIFDSRIGSPLCILWLYGIAFGKGMTARIFESKTLQALAPMSYLVYLLHITVARCYWLWTRGVQAEEWFHIAGDYPFPVSFGELAIILGETVFLGHLIDRYLLPRVIPITVTLGVKVCRFLSSLVAPEGSQDHSGASSAKAASSVFSQIHSLVKSLSGVEITRSSKLVELGLDSLGVTAFLGNLRARLPDTTKGLTIQALSSFDTVGELVDHLEGGRNSSNQSESGETASQSESSEDDNTGGHSRRGAGDRRVFSTLRSRSEATSASASRKTSYHPVPPEEVHVV